MRREHGAARAARAWRAASAAPLLALAATLALATTIGCTRRAPRAYAVTIQDFAFHPPTLEVAQGDTVVFTNADMVPHTATARDGGWDSKAIDGAGGTARTWRLVARTPGTHAYVCTFHPTMRGTITVR